MSLHDFFVQHIKNGENAVNEAQVVGANTPLGDNPYASRIDASISRATQRDILGNIFRGEWTGIRVPSAVLPGEKIPLWANEFLTYPFVPIIGYSNKAAPFAATRKRTGYQHDKLDGVYHLKTVQDALHNQLERGTSISSNDFIFYYGQSINKVGLKARKATESPFQPAKDDICYRRVGELAVQQILTLDQDGNLTIDTEKSGGTILRAIKSGKNSTDVTQLKKLTIFDLGAIVERMGGVASIAELMTGSADMSIPRAGGLLAGYIAKGGFVLVMNANGKPTLSVARGRDKYPIMFNDGNMEYRNFSKFILMNYNEIKSINGVGIKPKEFSDKDALGLKVRAWILGSSVKTVCEKLVAPFLLMTPLNRTYCLKPIDPSSAEGNPELAEAFAIYNATLRNTPIAVEEPDEGDEVEESVVNEAENEIDNSLLRNAIMEVCRKTVSEKRMTFVFTPNEQLIQHSREHGDVVTKSEGIKRTFIRILYGGNLNGIDLDTEMSAKRGGKFISETFTLDYSPLFQSFSGILNMSAPQKFNVKRFEGYMITYEYDSKIESDFEKESNFNPNDPLYPLRLLDEYSKKGGVVVDQLTTFTFNYFIEQDFISWGYEQNVDSLGLDTEKMSPETMPKIIEVNGKLGQNKLLSRMQYAAAARGLPTPNNSRVKDYRIGDVNNKIMVQTTRK